MRVREGSSSEDGYIDVPDEPLEEARKLRVAYALALLDHYERTHGDVGEHDHHCSMGWAKPQEPCTCGWSGALTAMQLYEAVDVELRKVLEA